MASKKGDRQAALSHERLTELLHYDQETGIFRWAKRTSNRVKVGDRAGEIDRHGHRMISIDGWRYMAHRLAWFYVYGRWPFPEIDHKNLIKDDNRINNLREATRTQNCVNRPVNSKRTGLRGVWPNGENGYAAVISVKRKRIYLGTFRTLEQAHAEYIKAAAIYHGEYGRV
jgi:hypothetical protein